MKQKKVWRYYCDFCGKGGLVKHWMAKHEVSCTANPERLCRLHGHATPGNKQPAVKDLIAQFDSRKPDCGMKELREMAGNCPACILAAIRQSKIQKWDGDPESPPPDLGFDFKKELASMWAEANNARAESNERRYEQSYGD